MDQREEGIRVHHYTGFGMQAHAVSSAKDLGWALLCPHLAEGEHMKD